MEKFQHEGLANYRIEFECAPGGGLISHRMIVESSIPLLHDEDGFDLRAVTSLEFAAVEYAKARGIGTVIFTRKY
jgi:hypothetical protein